MYQFTPLDFICTQCLAGSGYNCKTKSGNLADSHKARISEFEADKAAYLQLAAEAVEAMVPAIATPVRQLKEGFTLAGEPMAISACMKKLGYQIEKLDGKYHAARLVNQDHGAYEVFVFTPGKGWEVGYAGKDDETFETKDELESDILMYLIKFYYQLKLKKTPADQQVLTSLSARLLPLASQVQLDTLRTEIKALTR